MSHLPTQFQQLTDRITGDFETLQVPLENRNLALRLRAQFYQFRKDAKKLDSPYYILSSAVGARIIKTGKKFFVEFYPKDAQPENLALDKALSNGKEER